MNYPYSAYSWDILSEDVAVKHLDKSSFLHHSAVIPKEVAFYFHLEETGLNAAVRIFLQLAAAVYEAHIYRDAANFRYRLSWKTDFADLLIERFPYCYRKHALGEELKGESPMMRFERIGQDSYRVGLTESATVQDDSDPRSREWTDQELEAAVYAYFTMLNKELSGRAYNKAEVNRHLRSLELSSRSRGAIEFRMQNISAVLQGLCHPIIQGYTPRIHMDPDMSGRIRKIIFRSKFLNEKNYTPTAPGQDLDNRVRSLLKKGLSGAPEGRRHPTRIESTRTVHALDPLVKAWVLERAQGTCELCGNSGPFVDESGRRYLETHHVLSLSEGGPDTIENTVALCPNCHRRCHFSPDTEMLRKKLRDSIDRIV